MFSQKSIFQHNTSFITTLKKTTSLIFHLHFSSFTYKLFSSISSIFLLLVHYGFFFISIPIITSSMKLYIFSVLIKSLSNSFIMVWNVASEFVKLKNITIGSNNPSGVVKSAFYLSSSFILILL